MEYDETVVEGGIDTASNTGKNTPIRGNGTATDFATRILEWPKLTLRPDACAIIPAYNEAATIGSVILRTRQYIGAVFVVDDCSTDDTAEIARLAGARVISHSKNGGPGVTLQSGYEAAIASGFKYVVQIDGDGQHNPDYIPQMFEAINGCSMVIGSRFLNKSHHDYPFIRRLGITFFSRVVNLLTHARVTDVTSGYRLISVDALTELNRIQSRHWAIAQTIEMSKKGFQMKEISVEMPVRGNGKSQFSGVVYGLYPIRMIPVIFKAYFSR